MKNWKAALAVLPLLFGGAPALGQTIDAEPVLLGTAVTPDERTALFLLPATSGTVRVAEGERVGILRVTQIEPGSVRVETEAGIKTLKVGAGTAAVWRPKPPTKAEMQAHTQGGDQHPE
jgi:hypothetical protein